MGKYFRLLLTIYWCPTKIWAARGGSEVPVTGCIQAYMGWLPVRNTAEEISTLDEVLVLLGPFYPPHNLRVFQRWGRAPWGWAVKQHPFLVSGGSCDPPPDSPVFF